MRSYEEISNRIMERGDKLIESRKVRAAKIRHTSYAVSGMCAAAIAGIGVWHIASNIKKPDEGFHGSGIVTATEASSESTTAPAVTTTAVNTTAEKATTLKTTSVTSDKKFTETTAAATAATTAARTVINATATAATTSEAPVKETTTVPYSPASPVTTTAEDPTTPVNTTVHDGPTSTVEENVRTTIAPRGEDSPATTSYAETIRETAIIPIVTTTMPTGIPESSRTVPVMTTTNIQYAFRTHPTYATIGSIRYDRQEVIPIENVGGYISRITVNIKVSYGLTITDTMRAYSITGIDNEEAIAVRLKDTDEYYLFKNASYKKECVFSIN